MAEASGMANNGKKIGGGILALLLLLGALLFSNNGRGGGKITNPTDSAVVVDTVHRDTVTVDTIHVDSVVAEDSVVHHDSVTVDTTHHDTTVVDTLRPPVDTAKTPVDTVTPAPVDTQPQASEPPKDTVVVVVKKPFPWGPFHANLTDINNGLGFTGSAKFLETANYQDSLKLARANKAQIWMALTTQRGRFAKFRSSTDNSAANAWKAVGDTTIFSTAHWKAYVIDTIYAKRKSIILPYYQDGTVLGTYLMDEFECVSCWKGMKIKPQQVDTLAMYWRQFLGKYPIAVRSVASDFGTYIPQYVTTAWAQYSGATHFPAAGPPLGQWSKKRAVAMLKSPKDTLTIPLDSLYYLVGKVFADSFAREAKAYGMAIVLGVNQLDGGDGYPKLAGYTTHATRFIISPGEYYGVSRAFIEHPDNCSMANWKSSASVLDKETTSWDAARKARVQGFDSSPDIVAANAKLRAAALKRTAGPCMLNK